MPVTSCQLPVNTKLTIQNLKLSIPFSLLAIGYWLLATSFPGWAQLPASSLEESLNIPMGARPLALGEAWVGEASDISAIQWNPAGLHQISGKIFTITHRDLYGLSGVAFDGVAYAKKEPQDRAFAIKYTRLSLLPEVFDAPIEWKEDTFAITYASRITYLPRATLTLKGNQLLRFSFEDISSTPLHNLSLGLNFKIYSMRTSFSGGEGNAKGFGFDLGALYLLNQKVKLGFSGKNFLSSVSYGTGRKEKSGPPRFSAGASYWMNRDWLFLLSLQDFNIDNAIYPLTLSMGSERWFTDFFAARAGYIAPRLGHGVLTAGLGLKFGNWEIDYAYYPRFTGELPEDSQRLSVNYLLE